MKRMVPTSNIEYVDWAGGHMIVKFDNGKCVQYLDISDGFDMAIIQAPSAGSFFNRFIKGKYRYRVIDEPGYPKPKLDLSDEVLFKKYQHEFDSTRGLWCIDQDPTTVDIEWIRKNAFQLEGVNPQ